MGIDDPLPLHPPACISTGFFCFKMVPPSHNIPRITSTLLLPGLGPWLGLGGGKELSKLAALPVGFQDLRKLDLVCLLSVMSNLRKFRCLGRRLYRVAYQRVKGNITPQNRAKISKGVLKPSRLFFDRNLLAEWASVGPICADQVISWRSISIT